MSTMKVRVSKVMAKQIAKAMKEREAQFEEIEVVTMSERQYVLNIGTNAMLDAQDTSDYDWRNEEYKVIRVTYHWNFHAMPNYLTTTGMNKVLKDLQRNVPRGEMVSSDAFFDRICESIAV